MGKKGKKSAFVRKAKKLTISQKAMNKIFSYTEAIDSEIGGLLLINESKAGPVVEDAILCKQTASHGGVTLDTADIGNMLQELAMEDPSKIGLVKGWWHSHCHFEVYWSPTDNKCFKAFIDTSPTAYGIVVNKDRNILARADISTEVGVVTVNHLGLNMPSYETKEKYTKEVGEKVKFDRIQDYTYMFNEYMWSPQYGNKKQRRQRYGRNILPPSGFNEDYWDYIENQRQKKEDRY